MGINPSYYKGEDVTSNKQRPIEMANNPVERVTYDMTTTADTGFLSQINSQLSAQIPSGYKFDLPTEAQWEYACRAGTTTALNNGKNLENPSGLDTNLSEVAWYYQNWGESNTKHHAVGCKAHNAWGLYDMHGNVWEWCKDWYRKTYYEECLASGTMTIDSQGPDTGSSHVCRGGAWSRNPYSCRSASRYPESDTGSIYGFRLVLVKE